MTGIFTRLIGGEKPAFAGWEVERASATVILNRTGDLFSFAIPQFGDVDYITKYTRPLIGKRHIVMRFAIEGDGPVLASENDKPGQVSLYFQRRGDNGKWDKAAWRWWSKPERLTPGAHELEADLYSSYWTNVAGQSNQEGFQAALKDTLRVGMTFGGGNHAGHGVYAQGPVWFNLLMFRVE